MDLALKKLRTYYVFSKWLIFLVGIYFIIFVFIFILIRNCMLCAPFILCLVKTLYGINNNNEKSWEYGIGDTWNWKWSRLIWKYRQKIFEEKFKSFFFFCNGVVETYQALFCQLFCCRHLISVRIEIQIMFIVCITELLPWPEHGYYEVHSMHCRTITITWAWGLWWS